VFCFAAAVGSTGAGTSKRQLRSVGPLKLRTQGAMAMLHEQGRLQRWLARLKFPKTEREHFSSS
jgi:hypothetical protein